MDKTIFEVSDALEVPTTKKAVAKTINKDNIKDFWAKNQEYQNQVGCYVFAIRAGKGYTPYYVGKTTKSLYSEALSDNKIKRYQEVLADHKSGTPVMFFITLPLTRGRKNVKFIGQLEAFLINQAFQSNSEISNIQGKKRPKWGIEGVWLSGRGQPKTSSKKFKRCMSFGD